MIYKVYKIGYFFRTVHPAVAAEVGFLLHRRDGYCRSCRGICCYHHLSIRHGGAVPHWDQNDSPCGDGAFQLLPTEGRKRDLHGHHPVRSDALPVRDGNDGLCFRFLRDIYDVRRDHRTGGRLCPPCRYCLSGGAFLSIRGFWPFGPSGKTAVSSGAVSGVASSLAAWLSGFTAL